MQPVLVIAPADQQATLAQLAAALPKDSIQIAAPQGSATGDLLPPWLALELAKESKDASRILIAGLRCSAALAHLREQGYAAERAGNQLFGGDGALADLAALPGDTLAEQLAAITGKALTPAQAQHEAWQRDGWAGLSALGVDWDQARWLIKDETKIDPIDGPDHPKVSPLDDLIIALATTPLTEPIAAHLQAPARTGAAASPPEGYAPAHPCPAQQDPTDYEQAHCQHRPVALKPALVLYCQSQATPGQAAASGIEALEYLGESSRRDWLARLLTDPAVYARFDLELTIGQHRCRLIARRRPGTDAAIVDALVSRILAVALVTGRPLRDYSCTLYLGLDLHLDQELLDPAASLPRQIGKQLAGCQPVRPAGHHPRAEVPERALEPHRAPRPTKAVRLLNDAIKDAKQDPERACALSRGLLREDQAAAQALLYFLPPLRERIFDTGSDTQEARTCEGTANPTPPAGIRHWRLSSDSLHGDRAATLTVTGRVDRFAKAPTDAVAAVEDISLFGLPNGLFVLTIRLGFTEAQQRNARCFASERDDWWHGLLGWQTDPGPGWRDGPAGNDDGEALDPLALQAERWLGLTKAVRLLRPAFPQQALEGKLDRVELQWAQGTAEFPTTDSLSPILRDILATVLDREAVVDARLAQIRDDRMVVNAAYALAGPPLGADPEAHDAFERLFSLALFVDRATDGHASQHGYAYDRAFVQGALHDCTNRRWQGLGSLYGATNQAQVAVGFGDYFAGPVTRVHVPTIHGRMLLLVLSYELTLAHFDRAVTLATRALAEAGADQARTDQPGRDFAEVQRRFIEFTNHQWLREVSSQTQGCETFDLLTRAFGLEARYALVKDKIERSHDYLAQLHDRALADKANQIGRWALGFALVALLIGVLAIPAHDPSLTFEQLLDLVEQKGLAGTIDGLQGASWGFVTAAGALLVLTLAVLLFRVIVVLFRGLRWLLLRGLPCLLNCFRDAKHTEKQHP